MRMAGTFSSDGGYSGTIATYCCKVHLVRLCWSWYYRRGLGWVIFNNVVMTVIVTMMTMIMKAKQSQSYLDI